MRSMRWSFSGFALWAVNSLMVGTAYLGPEFIQRLEKFGADKRRSLYRKMESCPRRQESSAAVKSVDNGNPLSFAP